MLFREGQEVEVNRFGPKNSLLNWYRGNIVRFNDGRLINEDGCYGVLLRDMTSAVVAPDDIRPAKAASGDTRPS